MTIGCRPEVSSTTPVASQHLTSNDRSYPKHGSLHRTRLPTLPPRRHEAVSQGHPLRHAQVRVRAPRHRRRACSKPRRGKLTDYGDPPAREAEGQALLRRAGAAVPPLLRNGRTDQGQHRRRADEPARTPAGQRRASPGLRPEPRAGPPDGQPRAHHRQRPPGRRPQLPGPRRAT